MKIQIHIALTILIALIVTTQNLIQAQPNETHTILFQTGSVSGKIDILNAQTAGAISHAVHRRSYGEMNMTSQTPHTTNEYTNMIVFLEGQNIKREMQHAPSHRQIDQRNAEFIPHVLPVRLGTVVDFVNRDNVYHNVFSLSPAKKFNIGRRPTGQAVPIVFDRPGVVELFCDIHSNMSAYVLVLENDFFTRPDMHGSYIIEHVPPGTYTIKVWHERLTSHGQTITIKHCRIRSADRQLRGTKPHE
jgi:plastocyanin